MKHLVIRRNPASQQWFCAKCGRTSDHISEQDAHVELDQHDCEVPSVNVSAAAPGTKTVRLIRKPYKMTLKTENSVPDPLGSEPATDETSTEKWRELCAQAADEQDPAKLMELIKQIEALVADRQQRLKGKGPSNRPPAES